MTKLSNIQPVTGKMLNSSNMVDNLVDILVDKGSSATELYTDPHNLINTLPAMTGNMVASDGKVYNLVDMLKTINISSGPITADVVTTEDGSNCQDKIIALENNLTSVESTLEDYDTRITTNRNDLDDLGDQVHEIQADVNSLKSQIGHDRFLFVDTIYPDTTKKFFEFEMEENQDYYLDCKLILSTSTSDIQGLFSTDGITYPENTTGYRNRVEERDTTVEDPSIEVDSKASSLKFNLNQPPSGLVDLHIEIIRGNSAFQPFTRATLEYINMSGNVVDLVEQIGGFNQYNCKKFKLFITDGTLNNLNNVMSHMDIYKRV